MSIELAEPLTLKELDEEIAKLSQKIVDIENAPKSKDSERLSLGYKLDLIELMANRDETVGIRQMEEVEVSA